MDIFHHDLEAIKTPCFRQLYLTHEINRQVLIYNAIACSKECQHMRNEMPLPIVQCVPVFHIAAKVYFFCCPKTGLVFFILLPYFWIIDGQNNKAVLVLF